MILFIGNQYDSMCLSDLCGKYNEYMDVVVDCCDIRSIQDYIKKDYSFIMVDINMLMNDFEVILEYVYRLKQQAKIIVMAKGTMPSDERITMLYSIGIRSFILATSQDLMRKEFVCAITGYYEINGTPFQKEMNIQQENSNKLDHSVKKHISGIHNKKIRRMYLGVGICGALFVGFASGTVNFSVSSDI